MGDNSSSSDSDNALLPDTGNSLKITSRNAATQTPELPRHAILENDTNPESAQSASVMILRVGDERGLSDFEKEAKALDIPDVVVEYIKDTCSLREDIEGSGDSLGTCNPAFDGESIIVRYPSKTSLRDDSKSETASVNLQVPGTTERSSGSDVGLLPIGAQNPRLYYSMPRNTDQKPLQRDFQLHSQPASPKLQRLKIDNHVGPSPSLMSLLQRQGGNLVVPPSPNFGYRPLESETSAVYTIIKTCVNSNALKEIHFVPALPESEETTPLTKRKFEYTTPPPEVERLRRRLQLCTDSFSLLFLLPGLLIGLVTPIFIIPMFMYPLSYFLQFVGLFLCSGAFSVAVLTLSGLVGNTVWHYNDQTKKLRPRIHCGRGPMFHFWGNSFYYKSNDCKVKEQKEEFVV